MKVLFALNNENISSQIVKKYQKDYKEIISYKNIYYFNAIIKELQRDKSYDRIVISEDLEPFANNNYDAIDKFLFEKLDSISDEATGNNGEDIPIILISTDRRTKSEPILVKLFGIGIYNTLIGQDRSISNVCNLINKPRSKKEAKIYYKIESDEVNYKSESEENVSEAEIQNIRNHYARLGKDEDRYVESFNNIAAQYNDAQLRIITKFLPLNVKSVLEEKSTKYQSVMTFGDITSKIKKENKNDDGLKIGFLNNGNSAKLTNPVIVPKAVKKVATKKTVNNIEHKKVINSVSNFEEENALPEFEDIKNQDVNAYSDFDDENINLEENVNTIKRGRGRPKKVIIEKDASEESIEPSVKRGRGRPKKIVEESLAIFEEDTVLPGFMEDSYSEETEEDAVLPGFDDINDNDDMLPGFDIPQIDSEYNQEQNNITNKYGNNNQDYNKQELMNYNEQYNYNSNNISRFLSKDKKIVSFVGTTKNGTSFLVNNVAKCLSSMGIKTAILDLTKNKNSYYIYTKNEEQLRTRAFDSIKKLRSGIAEGISVDKYLDVYTGLPGEELPIQDVNGIISTLVQNYSAVIMDCDFLTLSEYFDISQEIYIVQSMDILTIQPMTAFLRDLKAKDILKPEKIRIVINKEMKIRGLTPKTIVGGLAFYNDPAMAFMTELFDKETAKYCSVPFEEEVCSKYLEGVMDCEISINHYTKTFNIKLKELANIVYPLLGNKYKPMGDYSSNNKFSANMNNTLEQMKNKY